MMTDRPSLDHTVIAMRQDETSDLPRIEISRSGPSTPDPIGYHQIDQSTSGGDENGSRGCTETKPQGGHITESDTVRERNTSHMSNLQAPQTHGPCLQQARSLRRVSSALSAATAPPIDFRDLTAMYTVVASRRDAFDNLLWQCEYI